MLRWKDGTKNQLPVASLPEEIETQTAMRFRNVLKQHGLTDHEVQKLLPDLMDEVGYAAAGRPHQLASDARGRPPDGMSNLLSVQIASILDKHGFKGNWRGSSAYLRDGLVAELEAVAQTAYRQAASYDAPGVITRPARISEAKSRLGRVHRNNPLPARSKSE